MHELDARWTLSFQRNVPGVEDYSATIHEIGSFSTVEGFWGHFAHLKRPSEIAEQTEYHLFREGVRGLWEDEANMNGGKWFAMVTKEFSAKYWERVAIALVGALLPETIVGEVLAIKEDMNVLSLWSSRGRTGENDDALCNEAAQIAAVLDLPKGAVLKFRNHKKGAIGHFSFQVRAVAHAVE